MSFYPNSANGPSVLKKNSGYSAGKTLSTTDQYPDQSPKAAEVPFSSNSNDIIQLGFGYLFSDKSIPEEAVLALMHGQDGIARYSQKLSNEFGRSLAIVLFRCAQMVFRARSGMETSTVFGDQVVVMGHAVIDSLDLSPEEVHDCLARLTEMNVLTHYTCDRGGERIFDNWYTIADEDNHFPPKGQLKFK